MWYKRCGNRNSLSKTRLYSRSFQIQMINQPTKQICQIEWITHFFLNSSIRHLDWVRKSWLDPKVLIGSKKLIWIRKYYLESKKLGPKVFNKSQNLLGIKKFRKKSKIFLLKIRKTHSGNDKQNTKQSTNLVPCKFQYLFNRSICIVLNVMLLTTQTSN